MVLLRCSAEAVRTNLEELSLHSPSIAVKRSGLGDAESWVIATREICDDLKFRHAIAIAREKTGLLGGRIFRLLHVHKRLEEKQISEMAVAPKKLVRQMLYALVKAKLISLQEIPRGADRTPARSFYCWGVPTDKVLEMLLESFLFSWCNIRIRLDAEESTVRPLQQRVHISDTLTAADQERWAAWNKAADRLENAMSRLNSLIQLFRDF